MRKAVDIQELVAKINEEQEARKTSLNDFVVNVESVITNAVITQPVIDDNGKEGETYVRFTIEDRVLPFYDQNGKPQNGNSVLLFKNQLIQAMLNSPELAIYANVAYLSSKDDKGLQRISSLLAKRKITLAFVQLDPGDNYVDPATGIQFDTTTDRPLFKYSIVSIE